MAAQKTPISAVIFDCDGVLLDTLAIYRSIESDLVGAPYSESLQARYNGLSPHDTAVQIIAAFNLQISPEAYVARRADLLVEKLPDAPLVDGVADIVHRIDAMGIPMAVATSSSRRLHTAKTTRHAELFGLFRTQICGDQVAQAKPAPEIFQKAAAAIGEFPPDSVLVFEDACSGIKAANAAGMPVVFLANPNVDWQAELDLAGATPTVVVTRFADFDFGSFVWNKPLNS
jgi:pseudouridine-5'-monophosphatase